MPKIWLQLGRPLLYFECRHHVLELIPKRLFDKLIEKSSCPDLGTLVKNFQTSWKSMDHANYQPATLDPVAAEILTPDRAQKVIDFALATLKVSFLYYLSNYNAYWRWAVNYFFRSFSEASDSR